MTDPIHEVVSPLGEPEATGRQSGAGAPALDRLDGKRIGLVWTAFANGELVLEAFRAHLTARYPDLQFTDLMPGRGLRWGDYPDPSIGECARELGIDAAIVTAGC